ncbi:MAG: MoxR family ATPase [Spirochaetales bacterium]
MQGQGEGLNPAHRLVRELSRILLGKDELLRRVALAVLVGGHVLIEDVPGVGKTTLAKGLAAVLGAKFRRIQFTPDLLPYDITGFDVFHPETRQFEFHPGPIFAQVVLADEINRATPKVQAALLEVMEEHQVTSGSVTRPMEPFFLVLATQNPFGTEGTYPLPSAQLDRFFLRLSVGYPDSASERAVWLQDPGHHLSTLVQPSVSVDELLELRQGLDTVHVSEKLLNLIEAVIGRTRNHPSVLLGLSPRAGVHLVKAVRAWAWLAGRDFATARDVAEIAVDVLAHRLQLRDLGLSAQAVLQTVLDEELARHEA